MPGDTTVFIVSQRASSLMHADQIIVLDDGGVAGMGTHDELLKNCEVYQEIYYSQFAKRTEWRCIMTQENEKKEKQKETLVKVLRYIKPYRVVLALTIFMAFISVALTLYLPILTGDAVDMLSLIGTEEFWPGLFDILKKWRW